MLVVSIVLNELVALVRGMPHNLCPNISVPLFPSFQNFLAILLRFSYCITKANILFRLSSSLLVLLFEKTLDTLDEKV